VVGPREYSELGARQHIFNLVATVISLRFFDADRLMRRVLYMKQADFSTSLTPPSLFTKPRLNPSLRHVVSFVLHESRITLLIAAVASQQTRCSIAATRLAVMRR